MRKAPPVSWQEQVFGPMVARNMENYQIRHLANAYDLSRDSRLAKAIVKKVNATLEAEERRRGIKRVRPGELLLRTHRGPIILPLRTEEMLGRVIKGERLSAVRADILEIARQRFRDLHPDASNETVAKFLRCIYPGQAPRAKPGKGSCWLRPREERPWAEHDELEETGARRAEKDAAKGRRRAERQPPRPAHRRETLAELQRFLLTEAAVAPALCEPMLAELVALRARCCPRLSTLESGQMPVVAMHPAAGRSLWQSMRYQPLQPVVVSVLAEGEARQLRYNPPTSTEQLTEHYGRRAARVLTEAYAQDGLISYAELEWIFLVSAETISRGIDSYQRRNQVVLPCPGTVLDMGRMLTHKSLIVRLHLQGHSVLEIARATFHHPRSVDAYLRDFDAVLICHLYGMPPPLIASVIHKGTSLVDEYLDLIGKYLKDVDTMRGHLHDRGVKVPLALRRGG